MDLSNKYPHLSQEHLDALEKSHDDKQLQVPKWLEGSGVKIPTIGDINQARQGKKQRPDYRLFPIYQSIKVMEDKCKATMDELFVQLPDGTSETGSRWELTEVATILSNISASNKQMLEEMREIWAKCYGVIDQIKANWIKDKVIQTRYSRKGAEYVQQLQEVGDELFGLSTHCINVQLVMNNLIKGSEDEK